MVGTTNTLSLNASNTTPGALITATGCGFAVGDTLALGISSSGSQTGATAVPLVTSPIYSGTGTNGTACYSTQFYVPTTLSNGTYALYLSGTPGGSVDSTLITLSGSTVGGASLTASPTAIAAGGSTTLTGSGFSPNVSVNLNAFGSSQTVSTGGGTFAATLTVPAGTAGGTYTVTAVDAAGHTAGATITVVTSTGIVSVSSSSGTSGQMVTVTGSGFADNEQFSLALSALSSPLAAVSGSTQMLTDGSTGAFTAQYLVPAVAAGSYFLYAQGQTSGLRATTPFNVLSGPAAQVAAPTAALSAVSTASTTRYFAAGYTGTVSGNGKAAFTDRMYYYNSGLTASTVTTTYAVYYAASNTDTQVVETDQVAAGATVSRSVNNDVGNDRIVSATVQASSGIVAEQVISRVAASGATLDTASSLGSSTAGTSWYFAEGYTGITFQEYLTIYNPGSSAAHAQIQYLPNDTAMPVPVSETVPANGQVTINVRSQYNQLEPAGSKNIAVQVTSDSPVVTDREMYWGDGSGSAKYGSSYSPAIATGAATHYFSLLPTSGSDQSFVTVLNPNSAATSVSLNLVGPAGTTLQTVTATVNAHARYTFVVGSILSGSNGDVAGLLTSSLPVVAEAPVYIGGSPNIGQHSGTVEQGSTGFQVGAQADIDSAGGVLQIYNPGSAAVRVQVTVGASVISDTMVSADSVQNLQLTGQTTAQGVLVLSSGSVSATIVNGGSSSAPVWGGSLG